MLAMAQTGQDAAEACKVADSAYLPAAFTAYNTNNVGDPSDDTCGITGNEVMCPGLEGSSMPGVPRYVCCYRPIGTNQAEYACVKTVMLAAPGGEQDVIDDAVVVSSTVASTLPLDLDSETPSPASSVTFIPQVTIPGSITIGGANFTVRAGEGIVITASTAVHYFALFYRFFVAMLAVVAVVMVMWGGFKRIIAAGSPTKITDANDTIFSALSGLVIALISYSLLSLVNPALVDLQSLDAITPIDRIEFSLDTLESSEDVSTQSSPTAWAVSGDNIINSSGQRVDYSIAIDLEKAASALKNKGISLVIASGLRSEAKQRELIALNCQNTPCASPPCNPPISCNPKPGRPTTCMMNNGPISCPHTTGRAVDVWPSMGSVQAITQKECLKNKTLCEQNTAMAAVIQAMRDQGFCKLCSEPWHFEKPKMSSCCN